MRILKLLSAFSLAGIFGLCLFAWFSGDDTCYRIELARYSVLQKAWLQYLYWDGRSLGIASLIQLFCLKYFPAPVASLVWAAGFTWSAVMMLKIVSLENFPGVDKKPSLISISLLTSILWLGMWKLVPDIIYWPTGGWYCVMCLLGLIWLYQLKKRLLAKRFDTVSHVLIFLLSIVCGNNSHNLLTALIFLALAELAFEYFLQKDKKAAGFILSALGGLLISTAFVMLAPGNRVRLGAIAWQGFNFSFLYFVLVVFAKYCYWLLCLFLLTGFLLWLKESGSFQVKEIFKSAGTRFNAIMKNKETLIAVIYDHRYLFSALSTVVVFSATSFFAVPRTALFFGVFFVMYALQISRSDLQANSKRFLYGSIAFQFLFILMLAFEMIKVNSLKEKMKAREDIYQVGQGKDVVVEEIPASRIPFAFTFVDISPDSAYWVNRCVAADAGLKTVRTVHVTDPLNN